MIVDVDAKDRSNRESHFLLTWCLWMELGVLNREGLWIRLDLHSVGWFVLNMVNKSLARFFHFASIAPF